MFKLIDKKILQIDAKWIWSMYLIQNSLDALTIYITELGTLANSTDPDEMQHNAAFHQGVYTVCKINLKRLKQQSVFL